MTAARPVIAVRGLGAASAAGIGCEALWGLLQRGETGLRPIRRFDVSSGPGLAGLVPSERAPDRDQAPNHYQHLGIDLAVLAAEEALREAGPPRGTTALVLGTNIEDHPRPLHLLAADIAAALDVDGPVLTVSTACASAASALAHAQSLLEQGAADRVLVGGYDVVTPRLYAGFWRLGAMARGPCRPFSEELGLSVGDGAAFLVLERCATADPGDTALLGWGGSADAHHPTQPAPEGRGVSSALAEALVDAGVEPAELDYLNAHGTGTESNDAAEWRGVRRTLGRDLPVSSTKSILGHTQGAAGVLELVTTLLCRRHGRIPHTASFTAPRPGAPPDPVAEARPRKAPCETFASVNAGFGGVNAAVVVGPPRDRPPRPRRRVYVGGLGVLGRHGSGLEGLGRTGDESRAPPRRLLQGLDPRELDPTTRWLVAAARACWLEAGARPARAVRSRTGLAIGQLRVSPTRVAALEERVRAEGVDCLGAAMFTRTLLVVPAGTTSMELGLRGPLDVLVAGRASAAAALAHGAWWLSTRPELVGMLAGGVDERATAGAWEGAAVAWLRTEPGPVELSGWAWGREREPTLATALAAARLDTPPWTPEVPDTVVGTASEGALAFARGVEALRRGDRERAGVVVREPSGLCCALVLERGEADDS